MKNESGVVILAVVFIALFSLLSGLVAGTLIGAKRVTESKETSATTN